MTNKEILCRNLINHKVFNILHEIQDLRENFYILYQNKVDLLDKYNLFDTQLNLVYAHVDKLCQLSMRIKAEDIVNNISTGE